MSASRIPGPLLPALLSAAAGLPLLAGCSRPAGEPVSAASAPPARVVGVVTPARGDVVRSITQPATVQGGEEAVLYAKTAGYLKQVYVDKGDRVKAGQL